MWVARDKDGTLRLFSLYCYDGEHRLPPVRYGNIWKSTQYLCESIKIDRSLFPNLTWEDEPIEVEIIKK